MTNPEWLECAFFVPIRRDSKLSDGQEHTADTWEWLDQELYARFGGYTLAPGLQRGCYQDPDTQERVDDESRLFKVAVPQAELASLRRLLALACIAFAQKCIYLSVAGRVEFVRASDHEANGNVH